MLDSLIRPPQYLGPKPGRSDLLVDHQRVMLVDPTDGSYVGYDRAWGDLGEVSRIVQAERTIGTRSG